MRKCLYIETPWVRYSQDYAFPSAAFSTDQSYRNWIYTNMIQMYYIIGRDKFNLSYFYLGRNPNPISYIPLLAYQGFQKGSLKGMNVSAIDFVHIMIDSGYYITCSMNEFYIPSRKSYQEKHFSHGVMLYGYDDEERTVMIAGYDRTGSFNTDTLDYDCFIKAFWEVERKDDGCSCFKRNNTTYEIDIKLMKELIYDFVFSVNTSKKYRMVQNPLYDCYWGIEACIKILSDNSGWLDQRYFYTIYEYSRLMTERFSLVSNLYDIANNELEVKLMKLEKEFHILLFLCMKYNLRPGEELFLKIENMLAKLLKEEHKILHEFYFMLCKLVDG